MDLRHQQRLSNSFRAVRLLAFREYPREADQGAGPYLVVQRGLDPASLETEPRDFVLGREGAWVRLDRLGGVGWEEGRGRYLFPTASEVMQLLERLTGDPVVAEPPRAGPGQVTGPGGFQEALIKAVRDASGG